MDYTYTYVYIHTLPYHHPRVWAYPTPPIP